MGLLDDLLTSVTGQASAAGPTTGRTSGMKDVAIALMPVVLRGYLAAGRAESAS